MTTISISPSTLDMARSYEYVICGPPITPSPASTLPRKTLSAKRDHRRRDSDLRNLYRTSTSPTQYADQIQSLADGPFSSPTSLNLPPTPPRADDTENSVVDEEIIDTKDVAKLRSIPVTPVNQANLLTPDNTPPREQLRIPVRPFLAVRPSIASTRAESFRTAREDIFSEDEFPPQSPDPELAPMKSPSLLTPPSTDGADKLVSPTNSAPTDPDHQSPADDVQNLPSSPILPVDEEKRLSANTVVHVNGEKSDKVTEVFSEDPQSNGYPPEESLQKGEQPTYMPGHPSAQTQTTTAALDMPARLPSLRDRLAQVAVNNHSRSMEAFANVIGWNDGGVQRTAEPPATTQRWSGHSNASAVEAYVVDSPIKPRKRGTLRKVVKNESLRSTSSPLPNSNRTSLQSQPGSDSAHKLVHKKQRLNNSNRWSVGSEISKRSLSLGSSPALPKHEFVKIAVSPERHASLPTPTDIVRNVNQRYSQSLSGTVVSVLASGPAVTTPAPRRKRALSDAKDEKLTSGERALRRSSSLSAPTSRSASRANSAVSHQFSQQREQAEKDLRSTLERMESERLSASLRRSSQQSSSPTPDPRSTEKTTEFLQIRQSSISRGSRKGSSAADSIVSRQKSVTIELPDIAPGTKEWADFRPSTITGTPFSQRSALSTSPEIVEARAVSFFPHNNRSVQLIEPNRLSETPAVKALRTEHLRRANTVPERTSAVHTPRTSGNLNATDHVSTDSPLRNPRKPPAPPQIQFTVVPPTPRSETKFGLDSSSNAESLGLQVSRSLKPRPALAARDRSESFIQSLSRTLSLKNARNPKQDQDLDSSLNPFWRPRAFWDDEDYRRRMQQDRERELKLAQNGNKEDINETYTRSVTIVQRTPRLPRSNSITTGPMSLARRISERRKQRRAVEEHLASQQALVKQNSYSSLQRVRAGHRLYGLHPLRSLSLNAGVVRLSSLRQKMSSARARREDEKREIRREKLRKSIGADVVMTSDSRFPDNAAIEHFGGYKVDSNKAIGEMLENARAEGLVDKRGLRL